MIFLRHESFKEYIQRYPITTAILGINLLLFALMTLNGGSTQSDTLIRFGALVNSSPYQDDLWRYISAIFLHIGADHLIFNCISILIFAPPMERLLGGFKYASLYLGSGLFGNVISEALHTSVHISAGASGSIYGIYGAYLTMILLHKDRLDAQSRKTIVIILAIGAVYSVIVPQVNLLAHLGGLAGGFALFALFFRKEAEND